LDDDPYSVTATSESRNILINTAIIVAAGSGRRFGTERPKQFADLLGRPVIVHTLEKFERCPAVDEIVLVLSDTGRREFKQLTSAFNFPKLKQIVTGGATRAASVSSGLQVIDPATANIVAIHDGARPLVTVAEIEETIRKAEQTGAACLVAEILDTIKEIDGESVSRTLDRSRLRRALTPQAFRYDLIFRAFADADLSERITDECLLVERSGGSVSSVEGSPRNIKITHGDDLIVAAALLQMSDSCRSGV